MSHRGCRTVETMMTCRLVTILTSDPPQDRVGSSMDVSSKLFVDTTASSGNLQVLQSQFAGRSISNQCTGIF